MVVQGDRGYNRRWTIICVVSLVGNSLVVLSVAIKFATSLTRSHERQDEGHWIVIRNPGALDTVSFCGVLVYQPRESMEKSLRETSRGNACCKLTSSNHNPLMRVSQCEEIKYILWKVKLLLYKKLYKII